MTTSVMFDQPIAHRGLHDRARGIIENTASAFEAAINGGYAIECDLQLTSDGHAVVFHDDTLKRLIGREERVIDLSLAEMQTMPLLGSAAGDRPQTFSELLKQVAGRTLLQVELKRQYTPEATRALAKAAAEAVKDYAGPLVFESFDPTLIVLVKRAGFNGARGIITYSYDRKDWDPGISETTRSILRHLLHYPWSQFDFISCEQTAVEMPVVRFFRGLGKPVTSWTIKNPEAAAGVKGKVDQIVFEGFEPGRA